MNRAAEMASVTGVACSALLGHWSTFQILVISLTTLGIGTFVMSNLPALKMKYWMWVQLCKLPGSPATKWASICWLLILESIYLSLVIVQLRLGMLKQDLKLFYLGVLCRHLLLKQSYMLAKNRRRPMFGDQFLYAIKWLHILCGAKWPNEPSSATATTNADEAGQTKKDEHAK